MAKMQNRYPTFLSFMLSVCIYGLIFVLFIHFKILNHDTEKEKFTDDLNAYIDIAAIDIDDTPVPIAANKISETESKINVKESEKVEKEEIKTALKENKASEPKSVSKPESKQEQTPQAKDEPKLELKEPDESGEISKKETKEKPKDSTKVENSKPKVEANTAKSLFDDVDVKQEQTIASTKKSDKQTKTNAKQASSKQIANTKGEKSAGKSQRTGKYDKFLGGVEKILTNLWKTYHAQVGEDGIIEITINKNGRANIEIIDLGDSPEFNQKFRDFVAKLENVTFPIPPDGSFTQKYKMQDIAQDGIN
jgi:putative periplasmic protein